MSKHKFASNVVEKCVAYGSKKDRQMLIDEVIQIKPDGYIHFFLSFREKDWGFVLGVVESQVEKHGKRVKS